MSEAYRIDDDPPNVVFDPPQASPELWVDREEAGKGWYDAFTARVITFPDGQKEICVSKGKHFNGPAYTPSNRAKRGESKNREENDKDSGKAAKKRVRQACKVIGADRMVTLTYRENIQDREKALKHWKEFTRRLRRCFAFHYVAVMELQERGAIHFHVAVRGRQSYHLLRSIWQSVVGNTADGKTGGQVNVRDPHRFGFGKDGVHKLAAYIAKYCTKSMECREIDQKRYFASRGIPKPTAEEWRLASRTMLEAVQVAFGIAAEGNLDGLQAWCNNALGVVWIATAPHVGPPVVDCPF